MATFTRSQDNRLSPQCTCMVSPLCFLITSWSFHIPFYSGTHQSPCPLSFTNIPETAVLNPKLCQEQSPKRVSAHLPDTQALEASLFPVLSVCSGCLVSALAFLSQRERMRGLLRTFSFKVPGAWLSLVQLYHTGFKEVSFILRASFCNQFRADPKQLLCTARSKMRHKLIISHCKCASHSFVNTMPWDPDPWELEIWKYSILLD